MARVEGTGVNEAGWAREVFTSLALRRKAPVSNARRTAMLPARIIRLCTRILANVPIVACANVATAEVAAMPCVASAALIVAANSAGADWAAFAASVLAKAAAETDLPYFEKTSRSFSRA